MADPKNFVDLQAGFYNALAQGLGYSPSDPFQVIQPSPPLVGDETDEEGADDRLWAYLNNIPVASLTQNTVLSAGNQFLSDYQGVMSALLAAPNKFAATIGPDCFAAYQEALKYKDVKPGAKQFRNWALYNGTCSEVAVSGASALAAAMLDPIFAAQMNVTPYKPAGDSPVDFSIGYKKMVALLKKAPSREFHVSAGSWNTDTKNSWAKDSDSGLWGLWGGSTTTSTLSQKFSSSAVSLNATFANVLPFGPTPGDWYSSGAFGLAFHSPEQAPWNPVKPINWEKTFGSHGNMQRFAASLLIANRMEIQVSSTATYSDSERAEIQSNKRAGIWPFYSTESHSDVVTSVSFDASGHMNVYIASAAGVPVVIGCVVLPAAQYLGDEIEAAKILAASFYHR